MIVEKGLTANPGPKGYADPAMIARQIGGDLTLYLNNLNERIYMLEKQIEIQRNFTAELNRTVRGIKDDYKKLMNNEILHTFSNGEESN